MAFGNYLSNGTYTAIDSVTYEKEQQGIRFNLSIYSDNTKTIKLANKYYEYRFYFSWVELIAINQITPPENPLAGDWYHVSTSNATGEWAGSEGLFAEFKSGIWHFWNIDPNPRYNQADSKFYIFNLDGTVNSSSDFNPVDAKMWNIWFSPAIIMNNNSNNLMQRCYEFLKTQPGFENVTDI